MRTASAIVTKISIPAGKNDCVGDGSELDGVADDDVVHNADEPACADDAAAEATSDATSAADDGSHGADTTKDAVTNTVENAKGRPDISAAQQQYAGFGIGSPM